MGMQIKINVNDDIEFNLRQESKATKKQISDIICLVLQEWVDQRDNNKFKASNDTTNK